MIRIKQKLLFFPIIVVLLGIALLMYVIHTNSSDSIVPPSSNFSGHNFIVDAPYFGRLNMANQGSQVFWAPEAVLFSVYEYWYPGQFSATSVASKIPNDKVFLENWMSQIDSKFFNVRLENISFDDIRVYTASTSRIPLVTQLPLTVDQPDNIDVYLPTLVIGIDSEGLIVHDFFRGPYTRISFSDYNNLQERLPENLKNRFMIVTPNDHKIRDSVLNREVSLQKRPQSLEEREEILTLYGMTELIMYVSPLDVDNQVQARQYLTMVREHSDFYKLPPVFQVFALYRLAALEHNDKNFSHALELLAEAEQLNKNFSQRIDDWWPGYTLGFDTYGIDYDVRIPLLQAMSYESMGDVDSAILILDKLLTDVPRYSVAIDMRENLTRSLP
jgi:hypothetical protein